MTLQVTAGSHRKDVKQSSHSVIYIFKIQLWLLGREWFVWGSSGSRKLRSGCLHGTGERPCLLRGSGSGSHACPATAGGVSASVLTSATKAAWPPSPFQLYSFLRPFYSGLNTFGFPLSYFKCYDVSQSNYFVFISRSMFFFFFFFDFNRHFNPTGQKCLNKWSILLYFQEM